MNKLEAECACKLENEICDARKLLVVKKEAEDQSIGQGTLKTTKTFFAVSNLRRAVMTALIVFKNRIPPPKIESTSQNQVNLQYEPIEKMYVLSHLQEITKNTDSTPVTERNNIPWYLQDLGWGGGRREEETQLNLSTDDNSSLASICPFKVDQMKDFFVLQCKTRDENKSLREGSSGDKKARLVKFCEWARDMVSRNPPLDTFVLTGHSIWIREFFREFLQDESSGITKAWYLSRAEQIFACV